MLRHLLWSFCGGDLIKLTDPKTNLGIRRTYFWGVKHKKIHHLTVTLTNDVHYLFSKWPGLISYGDAWNASHFLLIILLCLVREGNCSPGKMHQAEEWVPFFMQEAIIILVPWCFILVWIWKGTKKLMNTNAFFIFQVSGILRWDCHLW